MADEVWALDERTTWRDQPRDRERKLEAERDRLRNELDALRAAVRTMLARFDERQFVACDAPTVRHLAALVGR